MYSANSDHLEDLPSLSQTPTMTTEILSALLSLIYTHPGHIKQLQVLLKLL